MGQEFYRYIIIKFKTDESDLVFELATIDEYHQLFSKLKRGMEDRSIVDGTGYRLQPDFVVDCNDIRAISAGDTNARGCVTGL